MRLDLATAATVEVVTIDEAKLHLRVDISDDDIYITNLIDAVTTEFEDKFGVAFLTQTWDWYMDDWPAFPLTVPRWPLQSITHLKYTDIDSNQSTYASSNYLVDTYSKPGRVVLKKTATLPSDELLEANGIVIRFVAGFGDAASSVPRPVRQAILMAVGDRYENRENISVAARASISFIDLNISKLLMLQTRDFHF